MLRPDGLGRLGHRRRGADGRLEREPQHLTDIAHRVHVSLASTSAGTSSRSGSFRSGCSTVVMPARCAASSFCLTPPIGSTRPVSDTSPVIATSARTGRPESSDASAVVIVTPALGPSLGTAPAGTCTWTPRSFSSPTGRPSSSPCERR